MTFKKIKINAKTCDEQNTKILNKTRVSVMDFSFSLRLQLRLGNVLSWTPSLFTMLIMYSLWVFGIVVFKLLHQNMIYLMTEFWAYPEICLR